MKPHQREYILNRVRGGSRVDEATGCWLWQLKANGGTVPVITLRPLKRRGTVRAVLAEMKYGAVPEGLVATTSCGNPLCVNPAHVKLATRSEVNMGVSRTRVYTPEGLEAVQARNRRLRKLSDEQVWEVRHSRTSATQLARELGVSSTLVERVRQGRTYMDIPEPDGGPYVPPATRRRGRPRKAHATEPVRTHKERAAARAEARETARAAAKARAYAKAKAKLEAEAAARAARRSARAVREMPPRRTGIYQPTEFQRSLGMWGQLVKG